MNYTWRGAHLLNMVACDISRRVWGKLKLRSPSVKPPRGWYLLCILSIWGRQWLWDAKLKCCSATTTVQLSLYIISQESASFIRLKFLKFRCKHCWQIMSLSAQWLKTRCSTFNESMLYMNIERRKNSEIDMKCMNREDMDIIFINNMTPTHSNCLNSNIYIGIVW